MEVVVVVGGHNAVAVVAVVEHNVVAAVVAVGAELQGIVEVGVAAAVGAFEFLDTPFVLVGVDTGVAALGAAPEKHIEPGQVG